MAESEQLDSQAISLADPTDGLGSGREDDTDSKVERLHSRANSFATKFDQGDGRDHIDEAIILDREALTLSPPGHTKRTSSLDWLSCHLWDRYNQFGEIADVDEAIELGREALALCPPGHPDRSKYLNHISARLFTRFHRTGRMEDLSEAIILGRDALALRPTGHPDRLMSLINVALYISTRHGQLGGTGDLDEAIALGRDAMALCPPGHSLRSAALNHVSMHLLTRYQRFGRMEDLNEAIVLSRESLALCTPGHPDRPMSLSNAANHLFARYQRLGEVADLNEAIVLGKDALALSQPGNYFRLTPLTNVSHYLSDRYKRLGGLEDLDEAIVLGREALALSSPGYSGRSSILNIVATCLSHRYQRLGGMDVLDDAIILSKDALALCPPGHPDRPTSLNNIANYLSRRYEQLGVADDLNEAIVLGREALALCTPGHPLRPESLSNLSACLSARYHQRGKMEDLDEAIVLFRDALLLRPPGHPNRLASLGNVAICLFTRYQQLGGVGDLDEAISLGRDALVLYQFGDPHRSSSLNNVANYLSARFQECGDVGDLNEAIVLGRDALALRPPGHPDRSMSLNNIGHYLSVRYRLLKILEDLDEAIMLGKDAIELRPPGHLLRPASLNNVADCLFTRYKRLGRMEDLDEAIVLCKEALILRPPAHSDRSQSLGHLANYISARFARSSKPKDKEDLFNLYTEMAHVPQSPSSADLFFAREWVNAAEGFQHPTTILAYETSLQLLVRHLATLPSLPQHFGLLRNLTSSLAVDAFSACLRYRSPMKAVELLEHGRGVFWSQLARLRSPLEDVVMADPEGKPLADEFTQLTSLMRNTLDSPGADKHDRLCHLNMEFQRVVTRIRTLPGLSRFLLPSIFSDLQQASSGGAVIIVNASQHGCDALIIFLDRDPVHIPLQITRERVRAMLSELYAWVSCSKSMDVTKYIAVVLREMWDEVVSPIVDILQTVIPFHSRIWWCPTAEFSSFPIHAAGPYKKNQKRLADLYVSSYTPTLSALIRARRHSSATQRKYFVGIGQANAMGASELHAVGAELANIGERIGGLTTFTRMEGPDSNIAGMSRALSENQWAHLSCHGFPNTRAPFESAFAMYDGHFTVEHIMRCDLQHAEFAYLSACHTTVGDRDSPDEMIHLASAMQFAGFRSVIGTMWAVDDGAAVKVTSKFYDNMVDESGRLDHTRAAFALHKTMKEIKGVLFDQRILYVHLGA